MSNQVNHYLHTNDATASSTVNRMPANTTVLLRRQVLAGTVIVLTSTSWVAGLTLIGPGFNAFPWCLTLSAIAFGAAYSTYHKNPRSNNSVCPIAADPPISLVESYALTYLAASLVLCILIAVPTSLKTKPTAMPAQVVDIELSGLSDFQNYKQLLPSTKEMPSLRKRTSLHSRTSPGALASVPHRTKPKAQAAATDNHHLLSLNKPTAINPVLIPIATQKATTYPAKTTNIAQLSTVTQNTEMFPDKTRASHAPPKKAANTSRQELSPEEFMTEVDPPELVELMDNEGDQGLTVWQPGGRSSGGTGATSQLANYLKELHKRIKAAWSPPRGQTRVAEILFRIRKTGDLVLVRILHSSQDSQADEAALRAITTCAPFNKLPADCTLNYLDVKYTFNYSVDQLSEVPAKAIH